MDADDLRMDATSKHDDSVETSTNKKKRRSPAVPWKKPADMPRRPLSAYNLFFQSERRRLLEGLQGASACQMETNLPDGDKTKYFNNKVARMGFSDLAKTVAARWRTLEAKEREKFEAKAVQDKQRYDIAVAAWRAKHKEAKNPISPCSNAVFHGTIDLDMSVNFEMSLLRQPQSHINDSHASLTDVGAEIERRHFPLLDATIASTLEIEALKTSPATRLSTSSGSLWTSISSLGPQDLTMPFERSPMQCDHTSTTAENSSVFDTFEVSMSTGSLASPSQQQARRFVMGDDETSSANFDMSLIGGYILPENQTRMHRSASFPFVPLEATQTPATIPRPMGQCHSHPVGRRSVAGRRTHNPLMTTGSTSDSARRAATFLDALPPPPFRLQQATIPLSNHDDTDQPGHHATAGSFRIRHFVARDGGALEDSDRGGNQYSPDIQWDPRF